MLWGTVDFQLDPAGPRMEKNDDKDNPCVTLIFDKDTPAGTYVLKVTGKDACTGTEDAGYNVPITVTREEDCNAGFGNQCDQGDDPIGGVRPAQGSVYPRVNLGRYAFGKRVGELAIHEKYPTNMLATPACLAFPWQQGTNFQCEVITNTAGIRQVRVAEGLANVVVNTTYKYTVEIYPLSAVSTNKGADGLYTVSGAPLTTAVVENPDGAASNNRLQVTDGDSTVSLYQWNTNGWDLVRGGGLRRDCKTTIVTNDLRIVTEETYGSNGVQRCNIRRYQTFDFGERLVAQVAGGGGTVRSNYLEYYASPSVSTGLLYQAINADGSWRRIQYETNKVQTNIVVGFLDEAPTSTWSLVRHTEFRYGTNAAPGAGDSGVRQKPRPRLVIEYLQGHEVSRLYKLYLPFEKREIRCATAGASWDDSNNLVTTYKWYDSSNNLNRLKSMERPDGVMEIYDYGFYYETNPVAVMYGTNLMFRTNITWKGAPNAGKTAIVDGKKFITVLDRIGQVASLTEMDIATGITNSHSIHSDRDAFGRPRKITYFDGTFDWTDHGCCGPTTVTNREGTVITYYRDPTKQQTAQMQNGILVTNVVDAAGRVIRTIRIGTNGTQVTQGSYAYDMLGVKIAETNALGSVTTYFEGITNFLRTRTTTYANGSTRIESYYRDGQLRNVWGTAVHPVRYEYGVEQDAGIWRRYTKAIKLDGNGADTGEWTKQFVDMLGRPYKTAFSDGATQLAYFNNKGQLVKEVDPDGVTTLHEYNLLGQRVLTARDVNRDGLVNLNGADRVQKVVSSFVTNGTVIAERKATYAWMVTSSDSSNLVSAAEQSVNGLLSWTVSNGVTNCSGVRFAGSGNRYVTNVTIEGATTVNHFLHGLLQSVTRKDNAGNQLSVVNHYYDAHGRRYASTDARNGTTYYTYNDADRVISTISPMPGTGGGAQTTSYEHDWAGRVTRTVLPDGTSVTNEYHPTGELKKTYGSRTYPVEYGYDAQGRRTNMTTWKSFAADSGRAITRWKYDGYRGFMTNKVYDDGLGPFYSYTPGGRLRTRTWARGVVTTYHTNALGETFATTYSDATPAVTNQFDRLGRVTNIVDGAGSRNLYYDTKNQLASETNTSGALIGMNLRYTNDVCQRRTGLYLYGTNTALITNAYAYDGASRMTNVSDSTYQAGYSYLANSPLISQISYRSNTTVRMTTTKTYDFLNRLGSISSQPAAVGSSPIAYGYAYNDANQPTRVNVDDGSFWLYEYDSLGQVTSGKRYWSDWTPVAGQQYEYGFDDIGNRTSTKAGGDAAGADLRSANYTANALNQYTSRDVPGYLNVMGIAHPSATLTVNSSTPYRKGEYFWKELSVANTSAAQWQAVTNIASLVSTNQTNAGNLFLPKAAESYTYDADGNLTSDGRWTNRWDAENRLIDMTSHASGPSGSRKSLQFAYDSKSRRYSKVVSNWTGSAWTKALDERFVYDGWNLIAAVNGTNAAVIRSFLWGLDLSGSLQGAGGVGGLIAFRQHSGTKAGTHFAAFDGNGNVMALANSSGALSGRYEYDPFGQTIRASGDTAAINPVRFSSKWIDEETDLAAYYGHRYLNPNIGRWLTKDLSGERGESLYSFCRNSPPSSVDILGLYTVSITLHFDVPPDQMPNNSSGNPGVTSYLVEVNDFNISTEGCKPTCYKFVDAWVHLRITTWYRKGADFNMKNNGGHSLVDHESGHAQIAMDQYAAPVEADLKTILNKCFTPPCAEAKRSWFIKRRDYHRAVTALAQWNFEGTEFAFSNEEWFRNARRPLETAVSRANEEVKTAEATVTSACSASGGK